jgi:deazaflavin-dependent oxidoreductase (nitroreductase family)
MPIPKLVARFNRYVTNPVTRLVAVWLPPFGVVVHRGRTSGHEYRTPVWAFRTEGGFVIALTYGAGAAWVRNVLTGGGGELLRLGRGTTVIHPRLVTGAEAKGLVPIVLRLPLRLMKVYEFLRLESGPRSA